MTNIEPQDLGLVNRGLRENWPIPLALKKKAINCAERLLDDPYSKPNDRLNAVRVIQRSEALNLKRLEIFTPKVNININVESMTDTELDIKLEELRNELSRKTIQSISNSPRDNKGGSSESTEITESWLQSIPEPK